MLSTALAPAAGWAEMEAVSFDEEHWELAGEVVEYLGQRALKGGATLKGLELGDGVIEVDMAVDGGRGFPGVRFRVQDERNTEMFYIRPHRSQGYSHALQYTPLFNGMSAWQLYSGRGFTAEADIPWNEWIHLRIELSGERARVYFNGQERPSLKIDRLVRGAEAGSIALTGPPNGSVYWANFRYEVNAELDFGPAAIRPVAEKMLRDWEISRSLPLAGIDRMASPDAETLGDLAWQKVTPEPSGLVNVSRTIAMSGRMPECIYARTVIEADRPVVKRLDFGYSDDITVFLNGRPVFFGESSFRARDTEFMGVVGLNDSLFLSLQKGSNELVFSVAEGFGGWGFIARLDDAGGGIALLAEGVGSAWRADGLRMPESAVVDEARGAVYVSNMNPTGPGSGDQGFVAKLDLQGRMLEQEWVSGLRRPTGMALNGDQLLVVERTGLAVVDTASGEIVARHAVDGAGFLNDVAVDENGTAYVSDSAAGVIYEVSDGVFSEWMRHDAFEGPNGVWVDGPRLLVGTLGAGTLITVDRESRTIERIVDLSPCACDGVVALGDGRILVSDSNGRVKLVHASGAVNTLVDSSRSAVGCADIGFGPDSALLVAPSLYGNTLAAYDLSGVLGGG